MNKIFQYITASVLTLSLSSCEGFLSYVPSDSVDAEAAFNTATDVENALNGVYYILGQDEFYGRNVVALGDMASDNAMMNGTSGHFQTLYDYVITDTDPDLLDMWNYGYKVIDFSARIIIEGTAMLPGLSETESANVKNAIGQAYGLKALAHFSLVNIFGLPYSDANKSSLGVVVVDKDRVLPFEYRDRATVEATYAQILSDIESARELLATPGEGFRFNPAALSALEARVNLYMGNWSGAATAAQEALDARAGSLVTDSLSYVKMWSSISLTSEDIFTISKTADDNLSAYALNTLYGSYGGGLTPDLQSLFAEGSYRSVVAGTAGAKFQGLPSSKATSNIPVFRVPELYLIIAEAKAQMGQTSEAVDALFAIAGRNTELTKESLPTAKDELLEFIAEERRRELYQEGHRWYDMRRTGELLERDAFASPFAVSDFVYPIPDREVNASGITQNKNWSDKLPVKKGA